MSEFINVKKANQMNNPDDEIATKFNSILNNEAEADWIDFFNNLNSDLGNIANTRLSISGLWNHQIEIIDKLNDNIAATNTESAITDYIGQLDAQIGSIITGDNDNQNIKTNLRNDTVKSLDNTDMRKYIQSVIRINNDESEIKDTVNNLIEWTLSVRSEVVEDLWGAVQDYRENRQSAIYTTKIIDQIKAKYQRLAIGSLLLIPNDDVQP